MKKLIKELKEHFTIGTQKWTLTVKYCILLGFIIGLVGGAILLLR